MKLPALISPAPFHPPKCPQSEALEKPYRQTEMEMAHEEKTSGSQPGASRDLVAGDKKASPTI
jgi:hypothetical protein